MDRGSTEGGERVQAVRTQLGLVDGGSVLAVHGLVGGGLVDGPAECDGRSGKGRAEQIAVRIGRSGCHGPVGSAHALPVGSPELRVTGLDAGRPGDEAELAEVGVAQGQVVEQRSGEVEEDRLHDTPAKARSSAHFASAAGRRLGRCSVGHPSTGVYS